MPIIVLSVSILSFFNPCAAPHGLLQFRSASPACTRVTRTMPASLFGKPHTSVIDRVTVWGFACGGVQKPFHSMSNNLRILQLALFLKANWKPAIEFL